MPLADEAAWQRPGIGAAAVPWQPPAEPALPSPAGRLPPLEAGSRPAAAGSGIIQGLGGLQTEQQLATERRLQQLRQRERWEAAHGPVPPSEGEQALPHRPPAQVPLGFSTGAFRPPAPRVYNTGAGNIALTTNSRLVYDPVTDSCRVVPLPGGPVEVAESPPVVQDDRSLGRAAGSWAADTADHIGLFSISLLWSWLGAESSAERQGNVSGTDDGSGVFADVGGGEGTGGDAAATDDDTDDTDDDDDDSSGGSELAVSAAALLRQIGAAASELDDRAEDTVDWATQEPLLRAVQLQLERRQKGSRRDRSGGTGAVGTASTPERRRISTKKPQTSRLRWH